MKNIELYEKFKNGSQSSYNLHFTKACLEGDLEVVKYLLTSPDLKEHADIHTRDDQGFIYACEKRNFELIKYLLTSPELKEHANIHTKDDLALLYATSEGRIDIVKFLTSSPDLKEHIDIHLDPFQPFTTACANEKLDILQYYIFELKIEKTSQMDFYLNDKENHFTSLGINTNFINTVREMFNIREVKNELTTELDKNNNNEKKLKI